MTDKSAQLKSILTAFYVDHQSNLHDGRSASRPDIDGYVRKIELLFACSCHDESTIDQSERAKEIMKGGG